MTDRDRQLLHASAELEGLACCLRREWQGDGAEPDDVRDALASALHRISRTLWSQVGDRDE